MGSDAEAALGDTTPVGSATYDGSSVGAASSDASAVYVAG